MIGVTSGALRRRAERKKVGGDGASIRIGEGNCRHLSAWDSLDHISDEVGFGAAVLPLARRQIRRASTFGGVAMTGGTVADEELLPFADRFRVLGKQQGGEEGGEEG